MKNTIAKIAAIALVIMMTVGFAAEATTVTTPEVTVEQPVIEQPVVEEPVVEEPVVEEPIVEEPVVEEPVVEEPVVEEPVVEEPVVKEPVVEEPVVEEPVVEEPVVEEPVVEEPVVEEPVVEEPVVEEPVVEEPVVEEPVVVDYSGLKVEIDSNLDEVIMEGEEIRLTSTLIGFEGLTYYLQWQYNDGESWKNVEGATEGTYTFIATEETLGYEWRLMVTL